MLRHLCSSVCGVNFNQDDNIFSLVCMLNTGSNNLLMHTVHGSAGQS